MSESNLIAILPSDGVTFHTGFECRLEDVSADLCRIASFHQRHDQSSKLDRFHDWWEHDGLHFSDESTDYHGLFQMVDTPRSLIENMTGDHRVFIALSPNNRSWYLRFFADWDDDKALVGEFSISLAQPLLAPFSAEVLPKLNCPLARESVLPYFQRIEA